MDVLLYVAKSLPDAEFLSVVSAKERNQQIADSATQQYIKKTNPSVTILLVLPPRPCHAMALI
jgi:hypothetical protein